jgi:anti-sigma28 factor (negative regulator of flagellin synthesis)
MSFPLESRLNRIPGLGYHAVDPGTAGTPQGAASHSPRDPQPGRADMEVNGLSSIHSAFPVPPSRPATGPAEVGGAKPVSSPQDAVEISSAGRLLEEASLNSELRSERLAQIKAAIDDGTYETAEKLDTALSKMIQSFEE